MDPTTLWKISRIKLLIKMVRDTEKNNAYLSRTASRLLFNIQDY